MTLSNGQALAGAHIPTLVPLRESREAAAERLDASTLFIFHAHISADRIIEALEAENLQARWLAAADRGGAVAEVITTADAPRLPSTVPVPSVPAGTQGVLPRADALRARQTSARMGARRGQDSALAVLATLHSLKADSHIPCSV
jgi:hypothetical protein